MAKGNRIPKCESDNSKASVDDQVIETMNVSLIDFNMTLADLSVAEHALREEPYQRLPCLAGTMAVTAMRIKQLRQEAMALRSVCEFAKEACRTNLAYASVKYEDVLLETLKKCEDILTLEHGFDK